MGPTAFSWAEKWKKTSRKKCLGGELFMDPYFGCPSFNKIMKGIILGKKLTE